MFALLFLHLIFREVINEKACIILVSFSSVFFLFLIVVPHGGEYLVCGGDFLSLILSPCPSYLNFMKRSGIVVYLQIVFLFAFGYST